MRNKEIYRNEIKSYIIRAGMTMRGNSGRRIRLEQQRPQSVGQTETRQFTLWRGR